MSEPSETVLPQIGYLYHYPRLEHPSDHFRLDIFIFPEPTEQHFDIERAQFLVSTKEGDIENLVVSHPWVFEKEAQVCTGLLQMKDRKGKKEEAYTFGGQLTVKTEDRLTNCTLVSSAPLLRISGATSQHALFIEEVEILMAERKALYSKSHEFDRKLILANPQDLYRACLEALIQKFKHFPHKDEEYLQFLDYLQMEKHRFQAARLTKGPAPNLVDIL